MKPKVWYVPGWLRAYPGAEVEFRPWDGDRPIWAGALEAADREAWRLAFDAATMSAEERADLTIVGHSLGGRIAARVLARLGEKCLKVRSAALLAAAIPYDDPDLEAMGAGSEEPVTAICNPDDVTLRYVFTIVGGARCPAFGANGTLRPIANVIERTVPPDVLERVEIGGAWERSPKLKELANHHVLFYLDRLRELREGGCSDDGVMVPQSWPTVEHRVIDGGVWWSTTEEFADWKLERHRLTGCFRIVSAERRCTAWGEEEAMRAAFAKVRRQIARG